MNKNSQLQDYEEEKKIDISPRAENGNHLNGAQNIDFAANIANEILQNQPSLDFYKAPANEPKVPNGKVLNNGYDYVYGLEDSNDLDKLEESGMSSPGLNKENSNPKPASKKQKSRKKVFCNNGKAMISKPKEERKNMFGAPTQKTSLGSKVILEGRGLNAAIDNPAINKIKNSDGAFKAGNVLSKLTEDGLRKFEMQMNGHNNDISTIRSE